MNFRTNTFTSLALISAAVTLCGCANFNSSAEAQETASVPVENTENTQATVPAASANPQEASFAKMQQVRQQRSAQPPQEQKNSPEDAQIKALSDEIESIQIQKASIDAELALATAKRDAELLPLQLEKSELDAARASRSAQFAQKMATIEEERARLERELAIGTARMNAKLREKQVRLAALEADNREVQLEIVAIKAEYENPAEIVAKKQELAGIAVAAQPKYLKEPLVDGTLYISDRRIEFDGPVTAESAAKVISQINFFNNKNTEYPIFLVITNSPGGSVSAGYQIQKAMQSSQAPVYVLVKGMAASMAAVIATTAERSYCFANTMMLHHQISSGMQRSNLTVMRENLKESEKWYQIFGTPVAKKMGISLEEFTKQMYEHNSEGDWVEYGEGAVKYKWIDTVIDRVEETALISVAPNNAQAQMQNQPGRGTTSNVSAEKIDADGKRYVELPPLSNPLDCWWLYDKSGYYRAR